MPNSAPTVTYAVKHYGLITEYAGRTNRERKGIWLQMALQRQNKARL